MNSPLYYNTLRNDGLPYYEELYPFHSSYLANAHRQNRYDSYVDTRRQNRRDDYVDTRRQNSRDSYVDSICDAQNAARKAASKKKIKGLKKAVGAVINAIFG